MTLARSKTTTHQNHLCHFKYYIKMNTSKPYVVLGEAKESDSEEEIDLSGVTKDQIEHCKGKIVSGEAPESDEESYTNTGSLESVSSAVSALSVQPPLNKKKSHKVQSILLKKLCERNASLHKNLNDFITQTATNAGNELNSTNLKLLKNQVQMQEGASFLRTINENLSLLESSLIVLLSSQYLPVIRTDDNVYNRK